MPDLCVVISSSFLLPVNYFVPPELMADNVGGNDRSPPQIAYLRYLDTLIIKQTLELLESEISTYMYIVQL